MAGTDVTVAKGEATVLASRACVPIFPGALLVVVAGTETGNTACATSVVTGGVEGASVVPPTLCASISFLLFRVLALLDFVFVFFIAFFVEADLVDASVCDISTDFDLEPDPDPVADPVPDPDPDPVPDPDPDSGPDPDAEPIQTQIQIQIQTQT